MRRAGRTVASDTAAVRDVMAEKLLFQGLTPAQLDRVAEIVKVREVGPGEVIIREKDYGEALFVVEKGSVEVRLETAHGPRTLATIRAPRPEEIPWEGDFFGEMCLLDLEPRCASVVALEAARLWELNRDDLYWLFGDDKQLQLRILVTVARVLSRRLKLADAPRARAGPTG
jgi:CRP-like cAMP-binding protein